MDDKIKSLYRWYFYNVNVGFKSLKLSPFGLFLYGQLLNDNRLTPQEWIDSLND